MKMFILLVSALAMALTFGCSSTGSSSRGASPGAVGGSKTVQCCDADSCPDCCDDNCSDCCANGCADCCGGGCCAIAEAKS